MVFLFHLLVCESTHLYQAYSSFIFLLINKLSVVIKSQADVSNIDIRNKDVCIPGVHSVSELLLRPLICYRGISCVLDWRLGSLKHTKKI